MRHDPPIRDKAIQGILASNALTLLAALWQHWNVLQLMWPFWAQSLIIGWYARKRILRLRAFSTKDFTINGRPAEPTPKTQRWVANFFALHYGIFHLVYFVFLLLLTGQASNPDDNEHAEIQPLDFLVYAALSLTFWLSHRASHREHLAADLAGSPNLGTLMMIPYLRIIPMHLTLILGLSVRGSFATGLFIALKTVADVGMHVVEHRLLQKNRSRDPGTSAR